MHLNPESLSFALLISDLGSIARAANILGMKQATLSRKLTALGRLDPEQGAWTRTAASGSCARTSAHRTASPG